MDDKVYYMCPICNLRGDLEDLKTCTCGRDKPLGKAMCMHCFLRWDGVDVHHPTLLDDMICHGCDAILTLEGEMVTAKFIGGERDGEAATNRLMTRREVERAEEVQKDMIRAACDQIYATLKDKRKKRKGKR